MSTPNEKELLEIIAAKALLDTANQLRLQDVTLSAGNPHHPIKPFSHYLNEANQELWEAKQALKALD